MPRPPTSRRRSPLARAAALIALAAVALLVRRAAVSPPRAAPQAPPPQAAAMAAPAPRVEVKTSMGTFVLELYAAHAPRTVHNFVELSRRGYYNGTIFHRIIQGFMIQGGDPTGTGRGGQSVYGGKFEDEISRELRHTGAGVLSMANAGPDTNGSQFFITLAPTPHLDGKHTVFGRVASGMDVIKRIGAVQTSSGDRPVNDVRILSATPL